MTEGGDEKNASIFTKKIEHALNLAVGGGGKVVNKILLGFPDEYMDFNTGKITRTFYNLSIFKAL